MKKKSIILIIILLIVLFVFMLEYTGFNDKYKTQQKIEVKDINHP
jgi:hypothetical protein